jgi:hypothetical protein
MPLRPMTVTALSIDRFSAISFVEGLILSKSPLRYVISICSNGLFRRRILHLPSSSLIETNPPASTHYLIRLNLIIIR